MRSAIDFATPLLKFVRGFFGITDVEVIAADRGKSRGDAPASRQPNRSPGCWIATGRCWPGRFEIAA